MTGIANWRVSGKLQVRWMNVENALVLMRLPTSEYTRVLEVMGRALRSGEVDTCHGTAWLVFSNLSLAPLMALEWHQK